MDIDKVTRENIGDVPLPHEVREMFHLDPQWVSLRAELVADDPKEDLMAQGFRRVGVIHQLAEAEKRITFGALTGEKW